MTQAEEEADKLLKEGEDYYAYNGLQKHKEADLKEMLICLLDSSININSSYEKVVEFYAKYYGK